MNLQTALRALDERETLRDQIAGLDARIARLQAERESLVNALIKSLPEPERGLAAIIGGGMELKRSGAGAGASAQPTIKEWLPEDVIEEVRRRG